ncbi:aspartate--tRNA(Asn) ligase [Candidatus Pacearchaeota archaeon]|nr:aspartate--tRNA(Asn) ligase [Candidatus Pacearchaeota archaeon]MBI2057120.1 aspartate--tRNA(Asn) ligase [Candidatus Pacearchaeota archaeon]
MERSYISEIKAGQEVLLKGWAFEIRGLSKMAFILLRDFSGMVQCVIKDEKLLKKISEITLESVVEIKGKVKSAEIKAEFARKDIEIQVSELNLISKAEKLPIHVNEKTTTTEFAHRLDYRFLDFHKPKIQAIFKIQNTIENSFREFFYKKKFVEMQPPCIISAASEGGTDLFSVQYFEKKAFLAQSPQLYKQMIACSMEKTFTITPVWRAEKHHTTRHINEIRQMDIECAFMNQLQVMKELEEVVKFIVKKVLEKCKEELNLLNVKNLKIPKGIYLDYEEAVKKAGGKIGEDFTPEQEKKLCALYPNNIVFTYSWPSSLKPFYIMPKDENKNAKFTEGFDAIYGGMEISSGGQRIHLPELLIERLKAKGLNPKNFESYINSFRYGAPPHAGWSIGLERLTQIICGLENIKEATMFPRDRERLTP